MRRQFLVNIAFLLAINIIIKPLYLFGIDRSIQNISGQGIYGYYFEVFNFTFLFQMLNDLGIQTYSNRYVAQYPERAGIFFSETLSLKLWLGLAFGAAVLICGYFAGYWAEMPGLLIGMAGIQFLNSMIIYLRSVISGLGWYFTDSVLSVLDKSLLIVILGLPLMLGKWEEDFSIQWFVYAQIGAMAVAIFTAFVLLRRVLGDGIRLRWAPAGYLELLRESYPYALAVALMTIYTRIDGVMIGRLLADGKQQADWYASAYRLLDAMGMIGYLFAGLLLPMFSRIAADRAALQSLADLGLRMIWSGTLAVVPAIIIFRAPIMISLYENADFYSADLLGWLCASFVPVSGGYIFGTLLLATGKLRWLNRFYFLGIPLNIVLNLYLLPGYKAEGAAIATLATQSFIFIALLFSGRYWLGFSISLWLWLRFAALLGISMLVAFSAKQALFPFIGWWALGGAVAGSCFIAVLLRLLDIRECIGLLKSRA
ncbi:MAG: polysaccharide biosynthesis C-terminal domain-containing protein [Saprospiraceae bacterium]|jgi:O-antigen/teichoic acid export membrane protein